MDMFKSEAFAAYMEQLMKQHHVPGLSMAVVQGDEIASAGYGYTSLDPPKPCTADSLFDIASCSKSFTASSVGLLIGDKKYPEIQWGAKMSKLLPEDFVMPSKEHTDNVTVEDILSHRSGMGRHDFSYMGQTAAEPDTPRSVTRNLRNLYIGAPMRTKFIYCNQMFTVATHLIEVKTQKTFSNFLEERIFQPLNMTSTSLQPFRVKAKGHGDRISPGYYWEEEKESYRSIEIADTPEDQGAGSIITSANDFIKWVKALMYHEGPITKKLYEGLVKLRSFSQPYPKKLKPFQSPCFDCAGVEVHWYRGYMMVGHDGGICGFSSRFFFLPQLRFGVCLIANSSGGYEISEIIRPLLIDAALKVPEAECVIRIPKTITAKEDDLPVREKDNQSSGQTQDKPKAGNEEKEEEEEEAEDKQASKKKKSGGLWGRQQPEAHTTPLSAYVGNYWHPGYRNMKVEITDDKLFIDASDRTDGFFVTFEHFLKQTHFTAHLYDKYEGGDWPVKAKFELKDSRAVRLGMDLESSLNDLIWFDYQKEG
ncbi:beta-lactamase family protein, partial [Hypoxylon trugodes]|uniref:beta-lactamase family protein n=1 Tax=Hypoxylon trugodes TaxID=326681 RepID=UPI00219CE09F